MVIAMPPLNIPPEERGAITTIQSLSVPLFDQFISAMKAAPPIANPKEMAKRISKQVSGIPLEKLTAVLSTLYTLYYIRDLAGVTPSTFLADLMDGISKSQDLKMTAKDVTKLRSMFERILDIDSLNTVSKAARLQRDGERLYCTAKILSDIRPVFGHDANARPSGAVLTHDLRLSYHEGKEHKEFHVVLDSDDLAALAGVLERARSKDKTLREFLKETKLENLGD
jgi:hypothetical protein